ncbi:hypothetical protein OKW28_002143 [Paraburkholderia sp. 40]
MLSAGLADRVKTVDSRIRGDCLSKLLASLAPASPLSIGSKISEADVFGFEVCLDSGMSALTPHA